MDRLIFATLLLIFGMVACDKADEKENNDLQISMGCVCGWCVGTDSIFIDSEQIAYSIYFPCKSSSFKTEDKTNAKLWNDLNNLLDLEEFKKININTCYVCADGCDTWITVKKGNYSHSIRFGYPDSLTIQPIKPFINKLDSLRTVLSPKKEDDQ